MKSNSTNHGKILVAEPKLHVSSATFDKIISAAGQVGLNMESNPKVRFSHSAVFIPDRPRTGV